MRSDEIVPLEETVRIGRKHSVPVIVDAAGVMYPLSKMVAVAQTGDLVCFGSKYIGGPNSVGYVCGKKDLIDAVNLQGFVSFDEFGQQGMHGGIGRGFKVDRAEVVAAVVSLQEWVDLDHDARLRESQRKLKVVQDELKPVPHIETWIEGSREGGLFQLYVKPDPDALGKTARDVAVELAQGDPAVWVGWARRFPDRVYVLSPWNTLKRGEEHVVARRLREVLTGGSRPLREAAGYHPAILAPQMPGERHV